MPSAFHALAALSVLLASAASDAAVLYESASGRTEFTPGSSLELSFGYIVKDHGVAPPTTQFAAMPFTLSQDAVVTGAELAIFAASASANYSVQILPDASGLPGDSPVWTATSVQPAPAYAPGQPHRFSSVAGAESSLLANNRYWLYMACTAYCQFSWWADAANPSPAAIQYNTEPPYNLRWVLSPDSAAMFRVLGEVSPIPEPSAAVLALVGLLSVVAVRRRGA